MSTASPEPRDLWRVAALSMMARDELSAALQGGNAAAWVTAAAKCGFAEAQVLPFDEAAATVFTSLRAQRIRISTMDLRIASIALSRDMAVLTRNLSDFRKVPGLKVADWTV